MRCALVGAGAMARAQGKAFAAVEGVVLCGLVGRDAGRAAAAAAELGVERYADLAALWAAQAPALLILCVDTVKLSAVVAEAVAYPWRLFMEKPPGYDPSDALRIGALLAGRPDASPAWVALSQARRSPPRARPITTPSDRSRSPSIRLPAKGPPEAAPAKP